MYLGDMPFQQGEEIRVKRAYGTTYDAPGIYISPCILEENKGKHKVIVDGIELIVSLDRLYSEKNEPTK